MKRKTGNIFISSIISLLLVAGFKVNVKNVLYKYLLVWFTIQVLDIFFPLFLQGHGSRGGADRGSHRGNPHCVGGWRYFTCSKCHESCCCCRRDHHLSGPPWPANKFCLPPYYYYIIYILLLCVYLCSPVQPWLIWDPWISPSTSSRCPDYYLHSTLPPRFIPACSPAGIPDKLHHSECHRYPPLCRKPPWRHSKQLLWKLLSLFEYSVTSHFEFCFVFRF